MEEGVQHKMLDLSTLFCRKNNPVSFLCMSSKCKNSALVCGKPDCECTSVDHKECDVALGSSIVQKLYKKKVDIPPEVDEAFILLEKIYDEAIEKLSIEKEKLQLSRVNGGLNNDEIQLIDCLQNRKKDQLTGELVSKVKNGQKQQTSVFKGLDKKYVQDIWEAHKLTFQECIDSLASAIQPSNDTGRNQKKSNQNMKDMERLTEQNALLQEQNKNYAAQLQQTQRQFQNLTYRMRDYQDNMNMLARQIEQLNHVLRTTMVQCNQSKNKMVLLEKELSSLNRNYQDKLITIQELERKLAQKS